MSSQQQQQQQQQEIVQQFNILQQQYTTLVNRAAEIDSDKREHEFCRGFFLGSIIT